MDGKRPQEDRIDQAEVRRADADTQCEREHGDEGETTRPPKRAQTVSNVLKQTVKERQSALISKGPRSGWPTRAASSLDSSLRVSGRGTRARA